MTSDDEKAKEICEREEVSIKDFWSCSCIFCGRFNGSDRIAFGLWCTLGCQFKDQDGEEKPNLEDRIKRYKETKKASYNNWKKRNFKLIKKENEDGI